ncbi:ABC transporter permease [Micromonospora sp. STR1s_5]|nr:ABC transporter permease [Micromonospora sp. STR1s_5]
MPVDPWDHAQPVTPPTSEPAPVDDGLTPALRVMVAELDAYYGGSDCPSIDKTAAAMKDATGSKSWDSRGQVDKARQAYRAKHGIETKPAPKKTTARTTAPRARRTTAVQPTPTPPVPVVVQPVVPPAPEPVVQPPVPQPVAVVQPEPVPQPEPVVRTAPVRAVVVWPVVLLAAPAFIAIWGGWVGLGGLTGFGKVNLLPGIVGDGGWATIDSAITLPIGVETYGAYALYVWLSGRVSGRALTFARTSAIVSLAVGALGQVAYHLLVAAGVKTAPWWITTLVACLPVAVLGMGAALAHLVREER